MMTARDCADVASHGFWGDWLMSPGFGGAAAVVAAVLALFGVWRNVKAQRENNRKQQWWERARWALDLTLDEEPTARAVGNAVLTALADSEYAEEHETEVIDAAVSATLDTYIDQGGEEFDEADVASDAGEEVSGQAHLETPGEENEHGQQ